VGVLPGAEPFAADGGDVGVVLSHGFTGSPRRMRPWAEHLAAAGLTVRLRSTDVTGVILEESYHVATLDNDAPAIFAGSLEWVRQHTSAPAGS
jgi:hypothetical protein